MSSVHRLLTKKLIRGENSNSKFLILMILNQIMIRMSATQIKLFDKLLIAPLIFYYIAIQSLPGLYQLYFYQFLIFKIQIMSSDRRKFIKQLGSTIILTSAGLTSLAAQEKHEKRILQAEKRITPNDKIRIATIGMGIMGYNDT